MKSNGILKKQHKISYIKKVHKINKLCKIVARTFNIYFFPRVQACEHDDGLGIMVDGRVCIVYPLQSTKGHVTC